MKKRITLLMTAVMVIGALAGCGKKTTETAVTLADLDTSKYVTLAEYKGVEVEVVKETITDEQVTDFINQSLLSSYAIAVESQEGTVQDGDTVSYNCVGMVDGVAFEGGSSGDADWVTEIGSGQTIPGFEDGFIGMKVGETKEIKTTFPEDYGQEELKGKDVVFTVVLHAISRTTYPELTDQILTDIASEYKTVDECRAGVRANLEESAQTTFDQSVQAAIMTKLLSDSTFSQDPPQFLIDAGVENLKQSLQSYADQYGVEFADFLSQYYNMTEEQFNEQAKETATASAKQSILLEAIADKEGLSVTADEVAQTASDDAVTYGFTTADDMLAEIGDDVYRNYLVSNKVLDFLVENAVIK